MKTYFTVRLLFKISEFYFQILRFHGQVSVFVRQVVGMQILEILAVVFQHSFISFSLLYTFKSICFMCKLFESCLMA